MRVRLSISGIHEIPTADILADFVRSHARGGVLNRGEAEFVTAVDGGIIVAVHDAGAAINDVANLWAIAGIFPLEDDKFELGGALVRPDRTGFGLQSPLIAARLRAYARREGTHRLDRVYSGAAFAAYGAGSRRVLEAAGFEPVDYDSTPWELRVDCPDCTKDRPEGAPCCYQFYKAGPACATIAYEPGEHNLRRKRDGVVAVLDLPAIPA